LRVFALVSGGSAPPVGVEATYTQKASRLPVLAGAGVAAVVVVAAVVLLASGGSSTKPQTTPEVGEAAKSDQTAHTPPLTPAASPIQAQNPPPPNRQGVDRTVSFVSVQTVESDCTDGASGCRYVYSVGPFHFTDNKLRIDFTAQIVAPPGKGVGWLNDIDAHQREVGEGRPGVVVWGETDVAWPIVRTGGIASEDHDFLAPGRYDGWWEFEFDEPAGSQLTFDYPDFENYIFVVVPP
jgi:hypothetical protein